jgi:hypothetical protein
MKAVLCRVVCWLSNAFLKEWIFTDGFLLRKNEEVDDGS